MVQFINYLNFYLCGRRYNQFNILGEYQKLLFYDFLDLYLSDYI